MYIEKTKNGHYRYLTYYIEERTGKRKRVSVTLPKNTDKAKREANNLLAEKVRKINSEVIADDITFEQLAEAFQNARKAVLRPETIRHYHTGLKSLCGLLGADTRINKLSARFVTERLRQKKPSTANDLIRTFKTLMRWAYKNDYIETAEWLDKFEFFPEPKQKKGKYLEREELYTLIPNLKIELNRFVIELLALSGLRVGECLALQKEDVDFAERVIHVNKTMDFRTNTITEGAKTYSSNRDVFMQDELLELCKDIRKYMLKMSVACGFRSDYFLCDFDGEPLRYFRINKYFKENCERVLGKHFTLHSLRHTHASLMFEAGVSLEAVSLRLGHNNSRITKDVYLHITQKKREEYNAQVNAVKLFTPFLP